MATKNAKSNRGVGAPEKQVKYPQGAFTINQLIEKHQDMCPLTIRNHINRRLADGVLVKLERKLKKNGVGAPNLLFMLKSRHDAALRASAASRKAKTADPVAETPAATAVETPAVSETPAAPVATDATSAPVAV